MSSIAIDDDDDWSRPIDHVSVDAHRDIPKANDQGIRLYSTASASVHGVTSARYALQIFAPRTLRDGARGKDYMIATASLSLVDLVVLRDRIGSAIEDIKKSASLAISGPEHGDASFIGCHPGKRCENWPECERCGPARL
jgi:hypothetical protein